MKLGDVMNEQDEPKYSEEQDLKYHLECQRSLKLKDLLPPHHYVFVHRVMREICQTLPDVYFDRMVNDQPKFINDLWEITCEECNEVGEAYFSPSDIEIYLLSINSFPTVILVMPPPLIFTDAYIVAAILIDNTSNMKQDTEQKVAYITLERAIGPLGLEKFLL